ncbi:ABC transporter substrate-binding protein [Rhodospira trueperi]|uniref:sn-glycerol 3-phosphate transport system substrate-binding protein n=1 Tax=Rhodospira trueperi TaxID=69960 RepID=A0A1G7ANL7_9PROT|nr:ABC transporter substrate-binding protein [Rhodospira trueperi]SDE16300.1 sn-glycerol 3-phosphate transport system substrate-binding protein [Rhodospira trueperi]
MFHDLKKAVVGTAAATALMAGVAGASTAQAETELTMYYPVAVGGPLTEIVDGMVTDFMAENPDITVNAIYAGNYNDARIKALAALKGGEPAQLSVMFSIDIYDLIEQDAIVAFDDIVETDEEKAWLDSFYPTLMENGRTGGKTWGIPFQRSTIVMYYNKDAFREAGLDPETPPATWDALVEAGQALTKEDGSRWGVMIPSTGYPYWMFGALAMQNDQVLMNGEGTETYFDAEATVEALDFWQSLGAEHKVMPEGTIEWGTLRQNFLEGKTAIMWHSTGNLTAVKENAAFDFGVAMLPANERRGTPTGGGNFYIFKDATDAERSAALKLIRFMTAPERAAEWSMKTGYMGVSPAAYETEILQDYVEEFPYAAVARDQLEFATAELSTYQTGRVRKALDDAIQAALTGSKTPAEALGEAQATAERLLTPYR